MKKTRLGRMIERRRKQKEGTTVKERMIKFCAGYIFKYGLDYVSNFAEALKKDIQGDGFQKDDIPQCAKIAFKETFGLK